MQQRLLRQLGLALALCCLFALGALYGWRGLNSASAQSGTPIINTIAGGTGSGAQAKLAALGKVLAVALDPLGRGFYVVEESNTTQFLRFVNSSSVPLTLAGQTIQPQQSAVLAGGATSQSEDAPGLTIALNGVTGMIVDPSGNAVYYADACGGRCRGRIRGFNVSAQSFTLHGQTIAPGRVITLHYTSALTSNNQPPSGFNDPLGLAQHPLTGEFYCIGSLPDSTAKGVYRFEAGVNSRIDGSVTHVVAGTASPGTGNGDGGPATQARFILPQNLAFDRAGNLFIVDAGSVRTGGTLGSVRVVTTSGIISTLAGGLLYPVGLAIAPAGDAAYVAVGNWQQVLRLRPNATPEVIAGSLRAQCNANQLNWTCGDGGPARAAQLGLPGSTDLRNLTLAADAAGVYLPDYHSRAVRYVNVSNNSVTLAGTTVPALGIDTLAGTKNQPPYDNGPAIAAALQNPTGLAADAQGNLFIADSEQQRLRFVNRGSTPVTLFAGTASEQTVAAGQIVTLNNRVGSSTLAGQISGASFNYPAGLAVTTQGLWVVDAQGGASIKPEGQVIGRRSGRVLFINTSAQTVTLYPQSSASLSVAPGGIASVAGVLTQPDYANEFKPIGDGGPATNAILYPSDVAVDSAGNIYISDWANNRIRRINRATGIINSLSVAVGQPTGITLDGQGRLYIADTNANRILRQDMAGGTAFTAIQMRAKVSDADQGAQPRDVAVDATGRMFVTICETSQIFEINAPANASPSVRVLAGSGEKGFGGDNGAATAALLNLSLPAPYQEPDSTAFDTAQPPVGIVALPNADVLFADTRNHRVRRIGNGETRPVLAAINNQSVLENETLTVNFAVAEPQSGSAVFTLTSKPAFGTFTDQGNGSARLVLTPGFDDAGLYSLTLSATQGGRTEARSLTLTVINNNRLPVLLTAIGNQTLINGHVRELELAFADADGEPVELKLSNAPGFVTLQADATNAFKAKLRLAPNLTGVPLPAVFENIILIPEDLNHGKGASVSFNLLVTAAVISSFPVINVSPASYLPGALAPGSIVTAFGTNLATETRAALSLPLPTALASTTVTVKDSAGVERFAPLFFVSPMQVNYLLPPESAAGTATISVLSGGGRLSTQQVQIDSVAPGVFTADASGRGLAAALVLRVKANGTQSYEPMARFDSTLGKFVATPIELGPDNEQVYLIAFATGCRNARAVAANVGGLAGTVAFAGAQGGQAGLDQINIRLPRALAGRGEVEVTLTTDGKQANPVKVQFK